MSRRGLPKQVGDLDVQGLFGAFHLTGEAEPAGAVEADRLPTGVTALRLLAGHFPTQALLDLEKITSASAAMEGNGGAFAGQVGPDLALCKRPRPIFGGPLCFLYGQRPSVACVE